MDKINSIKIYITNLFLDDAGHLNLMGKIAYSIILLILVQFVIIVISKLLRKSLKIGQLPGDPKKYRTLTLVISNTMRYLFYFLAAMQILDTFGVNTSSIIATAGIGGIAIGFGAQSLVKDVISGLFILIENQFSVGDLVEIGGCKGNVEQLGMRVTKIRDFSGALHIIPNGSISVVTNMSVGNQRATVLLRIPNTVSLELVEDCIKRVSQKMVDENPSITQPPYLMGVTGMIGNSYQITVTGMALAGAQFQMERNLRVLLTQELINAGIELPKEIGAAI